MLGYIWMRVRRVVFGAAALGLLTLTLPAQGGVQPELSITGGTGVPGGTVAVTLALADDVADEAFSAGIDLVFPEDLLEYPGQFASEHCALADRLTDTHQLAGGLRPSGALNLEVAPLILPVLQPLGDGELVSCDFRILEGVPTGTAALEIDDPFLGDAEGLEIPVRTRNGAVVIVESLPTATPTVTATPEVTSTPTVTATSAATDTATPTETPSEATATATITGTPAVTATATPTGDGATPTATQTGVSTPTRTSGSPTATRRPSDVDDSCAVVPPAQSSRAGSAALLLFPAALLWLRRRRS